MSNNERSIGRAQVPASSRATPIPQRKKAPKPKWGRIALVVAIAIVLCGGLGSFIYAKTIDSSLDRIEDFTPGGRPPKTVSGMQNILMVGTDFADPDSQPDEPGQSRTDTIMLMHIPSAQDRAYIVSIPRDLYVPIPQKATDKECGNRRAKINAAFAWGEIPLLVKTVECFTSVRIDHVIQIDFGGFKQVVDALGGVDMPIEQNITSIHEPYRKFTKGTMHLNGTEALDYVRQRKQFPEGDFARMKHQQQLLKVMLDKAASSDTLTDLGKLNAFIKAMAKAMKVDQSFSLLDMAFQFRKLRSPDITFLTSPNEGSDMVGAESVVVSDRPNAIKLYNAIAADKMAEYMAAASPSSSPNNRQ